VREIFFQGLSRARAVTEHEASNLRRLLAVRGLTIEEVAEQTGLDRRTIMGVADGTKRPQAGTINRLASGLEVSADEFFLDPRQLAYRQFDCQTNPIVEEAMESHAELFDGWTEAEFDELHSRFGAGGALTLEGTLAVVREMNDGRQVHEKLATLELLYDQIVVSPATAGEE
jgi:transcriptional regulator with XRE-family HTH domain